MSTFGHPLVDATVQHANRRIGELEREVAALREQVRNLELERMGLEESLKHYKEEAAK